MSEFPMLPRKLGESYTTPAGVVFQWDGLTWNNMTKQVKKPVAAPQPPSSPLVTPNHAAAGAASDYVDGARSAAQEADSQS